VSAGGAAGGAEGGVEGIPAAGGGSHTQPEELMMTTIAVSRIPRSLHTLEHSVARSGDTGFSVARLVVGGQPGSDSRTSGRRRRFIAPRYRVRRQHVTGTSAISSPRQART